jgi:hypothetical protein
VPDARKHVGAWPVKYRGGPPAGESAKLSPQDSLGPDRNNGKNSNSLRTKKSFVVSRNSLVGLRFSAFRVTDSFTHR